MPYMQTKYQRNGCVAKGRHRGRSPAWYLWKTRWKTHAAREASSATSRTNWFHTDS